MNELELGASGATMQDQEFLDKNPQLKRLFNRFLDERLKQAESEGGAAAIIKGLKKNDKGKSTEKDKAICVNRAINQKSPSDTTIYVPALNRPNFNNEGMLSTASPNLVNVNARLIDGGEAFNRPTEHRRSFQLIDEPSIIDKVERFVESIRAEAVGTPRRENVETNPQPGTSYNRPETSGFDAAKAQADQAVIEAEKFRATIAQPPGMHNMLNINDGSCERGINVQEIIEGCNGLRVNPLENTTEMRQTGAGSIVGVAPNQAGTCNYTTPVLGSVLSDDDFFHLTCHVDSALRSKIEKGEFVDLDRLLPKDRFGQFDKTAEMGNPLQWIQNEGGTFLVPSKRSTRINSFRRWEQAFRVYATIYCGENPNRSREIWQYISVINTAANTFVWENVYN